MKRIEKIYQLVLSSIVTVYLKLLKAWKAIYGHYRHMLPFEAFIILRYFKCPLCVYGTYVSGCVNAFGSQKLKTKKKTLTYARL